MDNYSKLILTIIALSLIAINIKMWHPALQPPKLSEYVAASKLSRENSSQAMAKLYTRTPIVRNIGSTQIWGRVDVDNVTGTVTVKRDYAW